MNVNSGGALWRGVIGDQDVYAAGLEGWPLGYVEALSLLKQRGVLIGIISNNTESIVESRWEGVMHG